MLKASQTIILATILFTLVGQSSAWADHGGSSGGGGATLCQEPTANNGNPILFDLALGATQDRSDGQDVIDKSTLFMNLYGVDNFYQRNTNAFASAFAAIQASRNIILSDYEADLVGSTMNFLPFIAAKCVDRGPLRVFIPKDSVCQAKDLSPIVYYDEKGYAVVFADKWNSLGPDSKAAVLIHEALRRLQFSAMKIAASHISVHVPSDQELQALTLKIWQHWRGLAPSAASTFHEDPFFGAPLTVQLSEYFYGLNSTEEKESGLGYFDASGPDVRFIIEHYDRCAISN